MALFRRQLRPFAAAWVVFQAVTLSVFVPPSCCLGPQRTGVSAGRAGLHQNAVSPPEAGSSGAPCAMHNGHAGAPQPSAAADAKTPAQECAMRATCGGQVAALFATISHVGIVPETVLPDAPAAGAPMSSRQRLILRFESPDAPPPRS
jgi:hypothetical protein